MKHIILIGLVLVVLLGAFSMVSAQDSDNACEGGLLDGRCNSDWAWICGYYLEHWEAAGGWNSSYAFPDWCDPASLLPPRPERTQDTGANTPATLAGCYYQPTSSNWSFYYDGTSRATILWYEGVQNCTGAPQNYGEYGVEVSTEAEALAICEILIGYASAYRPSDYLYNSPANLWLCGVAV